MPGTPEADPRLQAEGFEGCRIEFDSRLTLVVAVVSRPPCVELSSTALLRPGGQSHVTGVYVKNVGGSGFLPFFCGII